MASPTVYTVSCATGWKFCGGLIFKSFFFPFVVFFLKLCMTQNNTIHEEVLLLFFFYFNLDMFHAVSTFALCCVEEGVAGRMLFCQVEVAEETP